MAFNLPKNKWFYAFLIAAVLALVAIVVAVVIGVTSALQPEYTEGQEVGIYYYDTTDGESQLTLSGGNRFTLAGPNANKTGTYTVEGNVVTLDFFKEGDGTATATIDGDKILLVLDGRTLPFLKKINYTVNFGDSGVSSVTVVNGKTVDKPEDPIKENKVFLGWYADQAFTTPFDFETTVIKANVTIYAKWAVKVAGVPDYNVSFDLGYDGAELPAKTTISGKLYGLEDPVREGYTFGGWFISMYEDGEKLSYAYDADTVFKADTTLYAVWHDDSAQTLKSPAVSVTDKAIRWNAVDGASAYKLTVIAPNGSKVIDNETIGATTRAFDFASKTEGEYIIQVVAVSGNSSKNSPAAVRYFANKALDRVSSFHIENGILIFGAVENAERYLITISCGTDGHVHTDIDNGSSTVYYLGNCRMQSGGIIISVKATASGYAASTASYVYDKTLAPVEGFVYDSENDKVTWNAVPGATNYKVVVTVGTNVHTINNGTSTSYSLAGYSGSFTVDVIPEANGYNSAEKKTVNVKKTAPASPSGLKVRGNVISWGAVDGAELYEVNIGGATVEVSANSINIDNYLAQFNLSQGQIYTVRVKAISDSGETSAYSEGFKVGYHAFDTALSYNQNRVYWTPVLSPDASYDVRVNGVGIRNVEDVTSAKISLTKAGDNVIEVRFVSDSYTSDWASITVKAYTVEYDTRSFDSGAIFEYLAIGDLMSLPEAGVTQAGYTFDGWYSAPEGNKGNGKAYTDGSALEVGSYTVVYASWRPNTYKVTLNLSGYTASNVTNGQTEDVIYKEFFTLPVPTLVGDDRLVFMGWFTHPDGTGDEIATSGGNSIKPYDKLSNIEVYAHFADAFAFVELGDGTYGVKKGEIFDNFQSIRIPAYYNSMPVSTIIEGGFRNCSSLVSIDIPDTIELVGVNAFGGCRKLEEINVYVVNPDETYETVYSSYDGTLIRYDTASSTSYLEVVPRGKTGSYTIPDSVEKILAKAFDYSSLTSVEISANVTAIPKNAFYYCNNLKTITFAEREGAIELNAESFYQCPEVTSVSFASNLDFDIVNLSTMLDSFEKLKSVSVGDGGTTYASIGGILTNSSKTEILYCPKAFDTQLLTIPKGVDTIAERAFYGRISIKAIYIPSGVSEVGDYAFYGCYGVTEITFEGARTSSLAIGYGAFANHRNLETVTFLGNGTTTLDIGKITIGEFAFCANSAEIYRNLEAVVIEDGVNISTIGTAAFKDNSKMTSFGVSDSVRIGKIGANAFENCARLTAFNFPATVTSIEEYAFANCALLSAVNFKPGGATTVDIEDYAFYNCHKLTSITLPDHLNEFRSSAFDGCENLTEILVNDTNESYMNDANGILYKKVTGSNVVTELLFYPKGLANTLGGVVNNLPSTLTTIGGAAFSNNPYLVSVTIPKTVTKIDDSAFANCANLTNLVFDSTGTALTVGNYAFNGCVKLSDTFRLPSYTTSIGNYAFSGCRFTSFVVPTKVQVIGAGAFYNCKWLEAVTFNCDSALVIGVVDPDATATVSSGAFAGCFNLKEVDLPKTTAQIGKYTFYGCSSLKTVNFGTVTNVGGVVSVDSSLTVIHDVAFYNCGSLQNLIIPNTVTAIGEYAFAMSTGYTSLLTEVVFETEGTDYLNIAQYAFANLKNLTKITLPARVTLATGTVGAENDAAGNPVYDAPTSSWQILVDNVPSLARDVFANDVSLAEVNVTNDAVSGITPQYSSLDGVLYNADKSVLLFCPTANVGVYNGDTPTYEVKIPTSVRLVASLAFNNCTALKTVTFDEYEKGSDEEYGTPLLSIGNLTNVASSYKNYPYAAIGGDKSAITKINLPSHLGSICSSAFISRAKSPIDININPDAKGVILAQYAFNYSRARSITLDIGGISTHAFINNPYLAEANLTFAAEITTIPNHTFFMESGTNEVLKKFVIPEHVTQIGSSAFYYCKGLSDVNIHSGITKIGSGAFSGTAITSVVISKNIGSGQLGANAFEDCKKLTSFKVEEGSPLTGIPNYVLRGCESLEELDLSAIAANVTSIGTGAFDGCSKLTEFDFSEFKKVTTLSDNAFARTGLTSADLSALTKLTTFNKVFVGSKNLKTIILPKNVKNLANVTYSTQSYSASSGSFHNLAGLEEVTFLNPKIGADQILKIANHGKLKVNIPADHETLVKENNVIYDKAKTNIYYVDSGADMRSYVIPSTVTAISDYAFGGVILGNLVIPKGVTKIGKNAFEYTTISSISISSTVTELGSGVFTRANIGSVIFDDTASSKLKTIGANAFQYSTIVTVDIPDSVTSLGTQAFYNCQSLKTLTLGSKIVETPKGSIVGCINLETINLQEGLRTINYFTYSTAYTTGGSFASNKVVSIKIPSTVTKIEKGGVFIGFGNLKTVEFAKGSRLSDIGDMAFIHCASLESINLPNTIASIGNYAFYGCESLKTVDLESTSISSINQEVFYNTKALASVKLPTALRTISYRAFYGSGIENLQIPATVTTVGESAFENAAKLKSVSFTSNSKLSGIGEAVFKDTTSLETLLMPNHFSSIGKSAFENSGLKTVTLTDTLYPAEIKTVGESAFENCARLTSFEHLSVAKSIGDYAFYNCPSLESAPVTEGLTDMGVMAFGLCTNLDSAYIPSTVVAIGGNPYAGLDASKISLGDENDMFILEKSGNMATLYDIDKYAIYGVYGASGDYVIDSGVRSAKAGAFAGNAITSITIPARFGVIEEGVFMGCTSLTSVTIEDGITAIGNNAFKNSGITTVVIPASVEYIGDYAFAASGSLNNVTVPATVSAIGKGVFSDCRSLSNVSFEERGTFLTMGTHTFAGCVSLKEVVLPTMFKGTEADALDAFVKAASVKDYLEYALPAYTFAGTGIINAVLPRVDYAYGEGVFENCKSLTGLTMNGFNAADIFNTTLGDGKHFKNWFVGCDSFTGAVTIKEFNGTVISLLSSLYGAGVREFHIEKLTLDLTDYDTYVGRYDKYLKSLGSDAVIYFDGSTYEDIVEFLKYANQNLWTATIYDKDGNKIIRAESCGIVSTVEDPAGNVIFTNPSKAPVAVDD